MIETGEPVVAVRNLRKTYGDVVAVDDVTFDIGAEEIFALVGPNGAGKTTAVEMLECLRTPTGGSARILGHDVETEGRAIKERIGVVPQDFNTFERLTVQENVALAREMYEEGHDVDGVLDQLDLEDWADIRFQALSGGLKRRTGIAMALVSDPEVLFLDEPTTGLDPAARRTTWGQIEHLADLGTTVVLTTHYMEEVEQLADRAALLVDGGLVAIDAVPTLIDEYGGDVKVVVETDGRGARDTNGRGARGTDERGDRGTDERGGRGTDERGDRDTAERGGRGTDERGDRDTAERGGPGTEERNAPSSGGGSDTPAADQDTEAIIESTLRTSATEVYRDETDDLVGLFETRDAAQEAFSEVHEVAGDRDIELTTAGMEDVFLRLAGGTVDAEGELT